MHSQIFTAALLSATAALAKPLHYRNAEIKCPIVFDGRVPASVAANPTLLDSSSTNTIYNADYVKGNNLKWSQILKFPNTSSPSRFDGSGNVPVEVTISDQSIFQKQNGFRRAGLQFAKDSSDGEGQKGVKTLHFSVKQDSARPLNLTHEYLNVWHEKADYSANQIQFQAGTLIDSNGADKNSFKILDGKSKYLYSVPIDNSTWQNFAITLDYTSNQVTIYYSAGTAALKSVAGPLSTDLTGGGQFQLGILKKPTGTSDVVNSGYQSKNLNEGQIYGGVFLEDSAGGCVSL